MTKSDPIFGFFPGNCKTCKQDKRVGAPSINILTSTGLRKWTIENLRGNCEDCLKELGLSRKGLFIPVAEMASIHDSIKLETSRLQNLNYSSL